MGLFKYLYLGFLGLYANMHALVGIKHFFSFGF